jgi:ABC-type nickel/cobalt efflux system permease component RcnA
MALAIILLLMTMWRKTPYFFKTAYQSNVFLMFFAFFIWPKQDDLILVHSHDDLPADHEHLVNHKHGKRHEHEYVIDEYHQKWPK